MNKFVFILIFFVACLLLLYATATLESDGDGWDYVGFPFTFYGFTSAKGSFTPEQRQWFSFPMFAADLFLMAVSGAGFYFIYTKLVKK